MLRSNILYVQNSSIAALTFPGSVSFPFSLPIFQANREGEKASQVNLFVLSSFHIQDLTLKLLFSSVLFPVFLSPVFNSLSPQLSFVVALNIER